jgi:DHA1 family bicyclomycin/chloramphenicol resistance-like MFS transporter
MQNTPSKVDQHWHGPPWALPALLAMLSMLGPFAIDTYIPAFSAIAQNLGADAISMQQTLSAYLLGFAIMNLFHGALADSLGRRPVVLWTIAIFTLASVGCALSQSVYQLIFFRFVQGLSAGGGMVVSRAVIRDLFEPAQAQKVMSQVTIYFGVAPAIAPIVGGFLLGHASWHGIFWFLALMGVLIGLANWKMLPETLAPHEKQPFSVRHLMRGYRELGLSPHFLLLCVASGIPFNGMFLYVLSAPVFLGEHLALAPTQFFWFFVLTISGIMAGAFVSGRMAGRVAPKRQIRYGFLIMLSIGLLNVLANALFKAHVFWAMLPVAIFAFGWAMMVPVITLLVLDLHPDRRGMASSLQAFIGSSANGVVAGVIAPLVMHSTLALAVASLGMLGVGLSSWLWLHRRWPEIGRAIEHPVA